MASVLVNSITWANFILDITFPFQESFESLDFSRNPCQVFRFNHNDKKILKPDCLISVLSQNSVIGLNASCISNQTVGTLRSDDGDGNGNSTKAIGLITKTTILLVHHAFLYISLPSLHDYDVKMPNFTLYRGRTQATTKLPLSTLGYGSQEFNFRRVRQHLKKLVTWSNRKED